MSAIEMIFDARVRDLGDLTVRRILPFAKKRAVGPFVFGVLAEHVSYSAAWNVAAASAVLAAACIAVGNRMSPTPQTATVLLHERNN